MKQPISRQGGASMWMMLYLGLTAAAIIMTVVKIGPHYYNDRLVASAMEGLNDDPDLQNLSKGQIVQRLRQSFQLNSIYHIKGGDIKAKRSAKGLNIDIQYDIVIPVIYNIDATLHFKHHFEQP